MTTNPDIGQRRLPVAPLLPVAAGFAAGIASGALYDGYIWWLAGAFTLLSAIFAFCGRHRLMALVLAALPGLVAGHGARPQRVGVTELNQAHAVYRGVVDSETRSPSTQRLFVTVDSVGPHCVRAFRVMLTVSDPAKVIVAGDRVCFTALLAAPTGYNAGMDYDGADRRLFQQRVSAVGRLSGSAHIAVTGHTGGIGVRMERWRNRIGDALAYSGLRPETAGFLQAVLMGERSYISPETREAFSRTGVAHVLALSGTHLAVIALMMSVIFFPLRLMGRRRWEWMATLVALWGYALLTGLSPSVTRAVIMVSFVLVAQTRRWQTSPLNSLCAAALLILVFRPFDLFAVSFQLSFAAVASLLMFAEMLTVDTRRAWLRTLSQWVGVSVAAVAGTAPLAAWYFHTFPVAFLLTNIPAALLLPPIMAGGVVVLCLAAAGIPCGAVVWLTDTLYNIMMRVVDAVALLPGAAVGIGDFPAVWLVAVYVGLGLLWWGWSRRLKLSVGAGCVMIAVSVTATALSGNRYECEGVITLRSDKAVGVAVCRGDSVIVFTDAKAPGLRRQISRETWQALSRRRLDGKYAGRARFASPLLDTAAMSPDGTRWHIGGKTYIIAGKDSVASPLGKCDYLVLTRGFRGDAVTMAALCRPDTVIVSPTLTPAKSLGMVRSLREAGYAVKLRL